MVAITESRSKHIGSVIGRFRVIHKEMGGKYKCECVHCGASRTCDGISDIKRFKNDCDCENYGIARELFKAGMIKSITSFKSRVGQKYFRITPLSISIEKTINGHLIYDCKCDCGKEGVKITSANIGKTKSCGCLRAELMGETSRRNSPKRVETMKIAAEERRRQAVALIGRDRFKYGDIRGDGKVFLYTSKSGYDMWMSPDTFARHSIKVSIRNLISNGIKRQGKYHKNSKTEYLLCEKVGFVRDYISSLFVDRMDWDNHGEGCGKWNIDHIIPMAYAKTQEEAEILQHYSNLQPMWADENHAKLDKLPENVEEMFATLKRKVLEYRAKNQK